METASLPKSNRGRVYESNLGHTKNEWGEQEDTPKIRIIEAYDLKWNKDKEKDESN
jgi:type 1 glutamine amidotransferase